MSRIEVFQLGEDAPTRAGGKARQFNKRCVADRFDNRGVKARASGQNAITPVGLYSMAKLVKRITSAIVLNSARTVKASVCRTIGR
ncbi:MAG: hypothetical protein RL490_297 [Pseudomonadota bacterium]